MLVRPSRAVLLCLVSALLGCSGGVVVERDLALDGGGPLCGDGECDVGEVCCNDSCGICAAPGGVCSQSLCD